MDGIALRVGVVGRYGLLFKAVRWLWSLETAQLEKGIVGIEGDILLKETLFPVTNERAVPL